MRDTEILTQELDAITKESFEKTEELIQILKKYDDVDVGTPTEDDKQAVNGFCMSIDARRQAVLKRLLVEWGGLLFI